MNSAYKSYACARAVSDRSRCCGRIRPSPTPRRTTATLPLRRLIQVHPGLLKKDRQPVAGNARHGIVIRGASTPSTVIQGNSIGLTPNLQGALPNGGSGIALTLTGVVLIAF